MKNDKWYFTISAIIFAVITVAHLARIVWMLPANVAGYEVPFELSGLAVILAGYLATRGLMAAHKS